MATEVYRASPADIRQALALSHEFAKLGILFLPVPILSEQEGLIMQQLINSQLNKLETHSDDN